MKVKEITDILESFAPIQLKEDWDNVGLQIGHPEDEVNKVLLALTPSDLVIKEAIEKNVDMIITHHPFIFRGIKTLRADTAIGRMSRLCIKHDISLYCAHTNLDIAKGGVNDALAENLGLVNINGLERTETHPRYKLVVFIPETHLETVKTAIFNAGGGAQGEYKNCAWSTSGSGQFCPQEEASPYLGEVGRLETVEEIRLEVLVDEKDLNNVISAMKQAHPYEEVAYDVLRNEGQVQYEYLGRIGMLPTPKPLKEWLEDVKVALDIPVITYTGDPNRMIEKVALCGGSACEFITTAKDKGADVYVTGDMKYHDAQQAVEIDLPMVDVSHYSGERVVLKKLYTLLRDAFGNRLQMEISQDEESFIKYIK